MATNEGKLGPQPPDRLQRGPTGALTPGCHLLRLTSDGQGALPARCDGTLRVEIADDGTTASGDLYVHTGEPDPRAGVPVFPRAAYRYYARVTDMRDEPEALELGVELHRFDHASATWSSEGALLARLTAATVPEGFPGRFLAGDVIDPSRGRVGELTLGWVSPYLRRAVIEIDRAPLSDAPLASEDGLDWRGIFEAIGWDLRVEESDIDLQEPTGESWSAAELHAAMLQRRNAADLDAEWRFWLACVRRLDDDARGIMFDSAGSDSNNIAREAAGIASDWTIPNEDPWGLAKGLRFGSARDLYFRTSLHEIGHAMGLYHNARGTSIMCPTEEIARSAETPQFPQNISWSYADKDVRRLRHMPDHWIRPGGVPFGSAFSMAPELPDAAIDRALELEVVPLLAEVPVGAPVRIEVTLRNAGPDPVSVPASLSLQAGHVRGSVNDPSGTARSFRSIVRSLEPRRIEPLASGAERSGSLTLLRGAEGALFPVAGRHTVDVVIEWEAEGTPLRVVGVGAVDISPPADDDHARAAREVIDAPDALPVLAFGGDDLRDGAAVIDAALANDQLRPHFAYLEAKRLASRFLERPPDLASAAALIEDDTVMSTIERAKAQRLIDPVVEPREAVPDHDPHRAASGSS